LVLRLSSPAHRRSRSPRKLMGRGNAADHPDRQISHSVLRVCSAVIYTDTGKMRWRNRPVCDGGGAVLPRKAELAKKIPASRDIAPPVICPLLIRGTPSRCSAPRYCFYRLCPRGCCPPQSWPSASNGPDC